MIACARLCVYVFLLTVTERRHLRLCQKYICRLSRIIHKNFDSALPRNVQQIFYIIFTN